MNIKSVYKFDYKIRGKYGVSSDPRFGQGVRRLVAAFNIPLYLPKDLPTLTIPVSVSICKYPRYKPSLPSFPFKGVALKVMICAGA